MRRGDVYDAAAFAFLHGRDDGADRVKRGRQVDRQDRVPLLDRGLLDGRDMLDAGIVDEHVDRPELAHHRCDHFLDCFGLRYVGCSSADFHRELRCQLRPQPFDFSSATEAVEHHIHA